MGSSSKSIAPGPRGYPLVGSLLEFRRDVLGLMQRSMNDFGDIVRIRLGPVVAHLICHPEHIQYVLKNGDNFDKNTLSSRMIRRLTGESLLVSNGLPWQRQRRLMQPAFSPNRMDAYIDMMCQATREMLDRWQTLPAEEPLDIASEMMRLTYRIIERALFSTKTVDGLDEIEDAITVTLKHVYHEIERGGLIPAWWPTPGSMRFRSALRTLDKHVYKIIDQHRAAGDGTDLLSLLMRARDEETGEAMSPEQLRNETIALLIAGHETTANAMMWLWYLLSEHPNVQDEIRQEIATVLGDRAPSAADLPNLPVTLMAIREAMRIYPPIWTMIRRVIAADTIGGYHIPAGSRIVISPFVTHRHPEFWNDPERFDPHRFGPDQTGQLHHYAYIPFGGGPRICIGQNLAKAEALVITAMVSQAFRLRLVAGHPVELKPGITLRSKQGMLMTLEK